MLRIVSSLARSSARSFALPRSLGLRAIASATASNPASTRLSKALAAELQEEKSQYEQPSLLKSFLRDSDWKLTDTDGDVNMKLVREFGGKSVSVEWQLVSPFNSEMDFEGEEGENAEEESRMESTDFTITVSDKRDQGVIFYCSTSAGEGHRYVIGNVRSFGSAAERESVSAYNGPDFEDLQESLQEGFDEFLAEVGVNDELCDFVDAAAVDKEQREYIRWLSNIQGVLAK